MTLLDDSLLLLPTETIYGGDDSSLLPPLRFPVSLSNTGVGAA